MMWSITIDYSRHASLKWQKRELKDAPTIFKSVIWTHLVCVCVCVCGGGGGGGVASSELMLKTGLVQLLTIVLIYY